MSNQNRFTSGNFSQGSGGSFYPAHPSPVHQAQAGELGWAGAQYYANTQWQQQASQLGLRSREQEMEADAIMRDFYQQVDRTDHHVRDQGQRVTVLETATTTLLESQANAQKRVQALANGITQQEELLAQRSAKVYAPLQFNSHN